MTRRMRLRGRATLGFTLIEVLISSGLAVVVVGAGVMLLAAGSNLHQSSLHTSAAARRCDDVLWPLVNDLRKASLASVQKGDGTVFADGDAEASVTLRVVERIDAGVPVGPRVEYTLDVPPGSVRGQLVRRTDTDVQVLARQVSDFRVVRVGDRFTFVLSAASGPTDDRVRTVLGRGSATPRNP